MTLDGTTDRQRILVQKTDTQGRTHDLTSRARLVASVPDRVRIVDGVLQPVNDGTLDIVVTVPGHRLVVPVRVRHARETFVHQAHDAAALRARL